MAETQENVAGVMGASSATEAPEVEAIPADAVPEEKVTLSMAQLQNLINNSKGDSLENLGKILADALVESKKPWVDPRQEENERSMRNSMREQVARQKANIDASQRLCPHLQGCNELSEFPGQLSSIVQHQTDTGEVIGICTNCQRIFRLGDPDYVEQMRRKSGNRMSAAGRRFFANPAAAIAASR